MKRFLIGVALGLVLGAGFAVIGVGLASKRTTLSRLSPDETTRACLVERTFPSLDRNFQVVLEDLVHGESKVLYHSPDEGRPYGSERFIWSKDGQWLVLVGRHCFVKRDLFLDNGDQLYFLYHVPTGRSFSNAAFSERPPIEVSTIESTEFTEPIRLKSR